MAQIGILTSTYSYPNIENTLDAVVRSGLHTVQFEIATTSAGRLFERLDPELCASIHGIFADRGLTMAAVSGTVNLIHPDLETRNAGVQGVRGLIDACEALGTSVVTLCTGSRDPHSMWHRHPDNDSAEAWADLLASLHQLVPAAEVRGVTLAFEPEVNNVVDSAQKARMLIDTFGSPALKVIMDPANIFHAGELPQMAEMLEEAFALLGSDIALAHAKDLDHDGDAGHLPAGHGVLDYRRYLELLHSTGFKGAVILHGLREEDVPGCVAFLRSATPTGLWS